MVHIIILNPKRYETDLENVKNVMDVFKSLNLNVDGYIVFKNGKPVPEDEDLESNDKIELLQVFSGG